jgi:hypothetical protein
MSQHTYNTQSNKKFNMKTSLQGCIGIVDGLCCASLKNVSSEERTIDNSREGLRKFFTSYDLSYLNSNTAGSSAAGSSSDDYSDEDLMRKDTYRMSNKSTDKEKESTKTSKSPHSPQNASMLHTVVPSSLLPRDYGVTTNDNDTVDGSNSILRSATQSSESASVISPTNDRRRRRPRGYGDINSWASCTSCPQLTFDMEDEEEEGQPRTLSASDTYSTVSMSQSYIWEEDEEDAEYHHPFHNQNHHQVLVEEDCFTLSSADSVFRRGDEPSVETVTQEEEVATTPTKRAASFVSAKTHEAYQYLLRMKPQNYMHDVSSSSDEEDLPGYDSADNNDNRCGLFLHYNEDER